MVIHSQYSSVYVSIPNSLTIPSPILPPRPLQPLGLSSKSVSLFLFCKLVHLYHVFLDSTCNRCHISPSLSDLLHSV